MKTRAQLEAGWAATQAPPVGKGTVQVICLRLGEGKHRTVSEAVVTVDGGLEGDRWAKGKERPLDAQVTLMNAAVADLIAHTGKAGYEAGDNLYVDLDLSEAALPVGTRLLVGTAVLEVTPEPHTGCKKFRARFGLEAVKWVNAVEHKVLRLRGVNCRVVEGGMVQVGDGVEVSDDEYGLG